MLPSVRASWWNTDIGVTPRSSNRRDSNNSSSPNYCHAVTMSILDTHGYHRCCNAEERCIQDTSILSITPNVVSWVTQELPKIAMLDNMTRTTILGCRISACVSSVLHAGVLVHCCTVHHYSCTCNSRVCSCMQCIREHTLSEGSPYLSVPIDTTTEPTNAEYNLFILKYYLVSMIAQLSWHYAKQHVLGTCSLATVTATACEQAACSMQWAE